MQRACAIAFIDGTCLEHPIVSYPFGIAWCPAIPALTSDDFAPSQLSTFMRRYVLVLFISLIEVQHGVSSGAVPPGQKNVVARVGIKVCEGYRRF